MLYALRASLMAAGRQSRRLIRKKKIVMSKENIYAKEFGAFCKARCEKNGAGWGQQDSLDAAMHLFQEAYADLPKEELEMMAACLNIIINPSAARQTFEGEKYGWLKEAPKGSRGGKLMLA